MDEPLSNLDAKLRVQMRAEIKHLQREIGITTIYVTHDQVEAMTLADRVAVMSQGRLQQVGPPLEIYNRPRNTFVAGFLGNPSMNLVRGELAAGRFTAPGLYARRLRRRRPARSRSASARRTWRSWRREAGDLRAEVFAAEQLGDSTLVTFRFGSDLLAVKAEKDCPARIGDTVGVRFDPASLHFFDPAGERLAAGVEPLRRERRER